MIIETSNAKYKLLCAPTTQDLEAKMNDFLTSNSVKILDYRFVVTSKDKRLISDELEGEYTKIGNFYLLSIIYV